MVKQSGPHLSIIHIPQGIEDPYTQQPWERAPREPRAGEEVTAYVVTRPRGAADVVSVQCAVNGGGSGAVLATRVPVGGVGGRWRAALGTFRRGRPRWYQR